MRIRIVIISILLGVAAPVPATVQKPEKGATNQIAWDLSYQSLLARNSISQSDPLRTWLKTHPFAIERELASWREGLIVSSILMEKPAFRGRQRETMWLVRTSNNVYFKAFIDGKLATDTQVPASFYDDLFAQVSTLQQGPPLDSARTPPDGISGYCGFLSLYGRRKSRQMLLTMEDFYSDDQLQRGIVDTEFAGGRLATLLEPLFKIRG